MKKLTLLAVAFLISMQVSAAQLAVISKVTDPNLSSLQRGFPKTSETFIYAAAVEQKAKTEKYENTIKQFVYTMFTDYSTPDSVEVTEFENYTINTMKAAIDLAFRNMSGDETKIELLKQRVLMHLIDVSLMGKMTLYIGHHGNSFGSAEFIAAVDHRNKEILMFGSDYAE